MYTTAIKLYCADHMCDEIKLRAIKSVFSKLLFIQTSSDKPQNILLPSAPIKVAKKYEKCPISFWISLLVTMIEIL